MYCAVQKIKIQDYNFIKKMCDNRKASAGGNKIQNNKTNRRIEGALNYYKKKSFELNKNVFFFHFLFKKIKYEQIKNKQNLKTKGSDSDKWD